MVHGKDTDKGRGRGVGVHYIHIFIHRSFVKMKKQKENTVLSLTLINEIFGWIATLPILPVILHRINS